MRRSPDGHINGSGMLNHTSGVPFVLMARSSRQNAAMRSRFAGLSRKCRVRYSAAPFTTQWAVSPGMASRWPNAGFETPTVHESMQISRCCMASLGRQTDKRRKVKGCNLSYLGSADPAVRARFPQATEESLNFPGTTDTGCPVGVIWTYRAPCMTLGRFSCRWSIAAAASRASGLLVLPTAWPSKNRPRPDLGQ
jgi:hypothetical protein